MAAVRNNGGTIKVGFTVSSFPILGSLGLSTPSTSLLSVRYVKRQEPASSPWCKNLTLGCPAKGEDPT